MQVKVRSERADEAAAIRAINDAAFGGPVEGAIVDAIRGTNRWIDGGSLVAEATGGRAVGHLLLSEGDLTDEDHDVRRIWMLGPVAVLPDWQRLGVGAALMHAAIGLARRRDQPLICLLGHADYYPRFGFESARGLGIEPPNPAWSDRHWLALRLPAWSNEVRGRAAFPPAFSTKWATPARPDGAMPSAARVPSRSRHRRSTPSAGDGARRIPSARTSWSASPRSWASSARHWCPGWLSCPGRGRELSCPQRGREPGSSNPSSLPCSGRAAPGPVPGLFRPRRSSRPPPSPLPGALARVPACFPRSRQATGK